MKTSFWDKVLMFLYVLIALAFSVCMALRGFGVDLLGAMFAGLEQGAGRFLSVVIGLGLAAIVVLLSAYMLMMLFGKGKKRVPTSFVPVESEDGSQVHMSLTAISQMARQGTAKGAFPLSHREGEVSFSGAEAQAMRMLEAGVAKEDVAAEVYSYLARAVAWLIQWAFGKTRLGAALISGGVASSLLLRELLPARLQKLNCPVRRHWGKPEMSGDNACGVALIGWEEYIHGNDPER